MRYKTSDKTFNFTTRNVNKDKIIDEKWPLLFGFVEETNNTNNHNEVILTYHEIDCISKTLLTKEKQ